jgi:hypothetical protein
VDGLLWLVFLVVLSLSAVGYVIGRSRLKARPLPPPPTDSRIDADDIRRALSDLLGSMVGNVPVDVITKYQSIHWLMLSMLPRMGQLEGTSEDLYILHRTASDYLPTAVTSYLTLALSGAADQRLPDGRTPHQVVLEQLDLIETRLGDIADALDRNDLDRLLIHGRFLEAGFGAKPILPPPA